VAHSKNHYENFYSMYSFGADNNGLKANIEFREIGRALDKAQLALDAQVWSDMQPLMPRMYGHLINQTNKLNQISAGTGEVHVYDPMVEYAHYMYEGEIYIDPVYRVGGFYGILEGKEGQWWSRRGVKKVPSGRPITYSNPNAVRHWDEEAIRRYEASWVALVQRVLENSL